MIQLDAIAKQFGGVAAVKSVSLTVKEGEFLSLLGPSGCGKTTTLRMIAGFESPSSGRIAIGGRDMTNVPVERRGLGMVFQNYALFPHLTVYQNVAFGLRLRRVEKAEASERVRRALDQVGLGDYGDRMPRQLSGGQQQRVSLARALVVNPSVLLLDEPLSNLDLKLREQLRDEIRSIQRALGITAIYVTHDQAEAMAVSDRIAVMNAGIIEQIGTPREIFEHPSTKFVANFIGQCNLFAGAVEDGGRRFRTAGGVLLDVEAGGARATATSAVYVAIRPSAVRFGLAASNADNGDNILRGNVEDVICFGDTAQVTMVLYADDMTDSAKAEKLVVSIPVSRGQDMPAIGETVPLAVSGSNCVLVGEEADGT